MKHYLGVDIGTFETKGVIVDQGGRIVATAARPHQLLVPQPGWAEHRPEEDWWQDFLFVTRKMLAESKIQPSSIAAIGTSAIGPCMLPVDADGAPLMNAVLYGIDTRAAEEIVDLTQRIGADTLIGKCGNALTSQSVGPKILWLKRHRPDLFARTHKVLTSTSYLVHRLTDRFVIDHYSAANSSPLSLPDRLGYSDALANDIIALDKLPESAWTTDIAGTVSARAAEESGLAVGTPVIVGTIDAA
ncbi:MAG TPA: FGGY family carbohydrate kinase, partial [Dongiaceae bacterium]|nr:FGGY family carbohydrate kinase [Dongiaceae bacterium]